jgi:hypothetical protein
VYRVAEEGSRSRPARAGPVGPDRNQCPHCGHSVGLNDWTWSPPWGFGYLGITFWNWPPVKSEFLAEIGDRLGHRTVHPCGKM